MSVSTLDAGTTTSTRVLRLGTRRSALATTQSTWVAERLRALGHTVELVEITTEGDVSSAPLEVIGGTGVFATAIRAALSSGEVDLAVHSLKDLPTAAAEGLVVAAIPTREDPRDVLVARDGLTLGELPEGSTVGTGSPRRVAQLAALGLGLRMVGIRGNVGTRLDKVASGEVDAVVLARAGLARLGRLDAVTEALDPLQMLPAAGQGALAVECRADDAGMIALLATLDDPDTRAATNAERSLLAALEAGCSAPVGALAEVVEGEDGTELFLRAFAGSADGSVELRRSIVGPVEAATRLGADLAATLLEDGAGDVAPNPAPHLAQPDPPHHPPHPSRADRDHPRSAGPDPRPHPATTTERAP